MEFSLLLKNKFCIPNCTFCVVGPKPDLNMVVFGTVFSWMEVFLHGQRLSRLNKNNTFWDTMHCELCSLCTQTYSLSGRSVSMISEGDDGENQPDVKESLRHALTQQGDSSQSLVMWLIVLLSGCPWQRGHTRAGSHQVWRDKVGGHCVTPETCLDPNLTPGPFPQIRITCL